MAHWAQINENNKVIQVLVTSNEDEDEGLSWLEENIGGRWLKTSYNTRNGEHLQGGVPFRKNFAGIGMTYDEERDAFIPVSPKASWVLNEETCNWEPPFPRPTDGKLYYWNEKEITWSEITDDMPKP